MMVDSSEQGYYAIQKQWHRCETTDQSDQHSCSAQTEHPEIRLQKSAKKKDKNNKLTFDETWTLTFFLVHLSAFD